MKISRICTRNQALPLIGFCLFMVLSPPALAPASECEVCEHGADGVSAECKPIPCPSARMPEVDFAKFQRVTSILAKVKHTDGFEDRVHKDPRVLRAMALFLEIADASDLPQDDLEYTFARLCPHPPWTWVPPREIRRIQKGLHLVSLGHAATTQPSSLYLFEGRKYYRIDSGDAGVIRMTDMKATDSLILLRYVRSQGTRPDIGAATLVREGGRWRIIRLKREEEQP